MACGDERSTARVSEFGQQGLRPVGICRASRCWPGRTDFTRCRKFRASVVAVALVAAGRHNIEAYLDRVAARPKVKEAMKVEGLLK
jgi:hypothetical protein